MNTRASRRSLLVTLFASDPLRRGTPVVAVVGTETGLRIERAMVPLSYTAFLHPQQQCELRHGASGAEEQISFQPNRNFDQVLAYTPFATFEAWYILGHCLPQVLIKVKNWSLGGILFQGFSLRLDRITQGRENDCGRKITTRSVNGSFKKMYQLLHRHLPLPSINSISIAPSNVYGGKRNVMYPPLS